MIILPQTNQNECIINFGKIYFINSPNILHLKKLPFNQASVGTRCAGGRAELRDTKGSLGFHLQRPSKTVAATNYLQVRVGGPNETGRQNKS